MDIREIEQFLYHEASLLDERRYQEWLDLFTDDATYWLPAGQANADPAMEASLIFDDYRALARRAARLLHPAAHSQTPPSRTSRIVGNVRAKETDAGELQVYSTFSLFESRLGKLRSFGGHCVHVLRHGGSGWRIASKKVTLVNSDGFLSNLTFLF